MPTLSILALTLGAGETYNATFSHIGQLAQSMSRFLHRTSSEPALRTAAPVRPRKLPAWGLSILLHLSLSTAILVTLRAVPQGTVDEPVRSVGIALVQQVDERREYLDQADTSGTESARAAAETSLEEVLPESAQSPIDLAGLLPSTEATPFDAGEVGLPRAAGLGGGSGQPGMLDGSTQTSVFGVTGTGNKFVYVFDRSGSMEGYGGRPLAAAKRELVRSLQDLGEVHQFQIIFYNERPRIFQPSAESPRLVWGDAVAKREAIRFVQGIVASGGTRHMQALRAALGMRPDVVFFLTDADEPQLTVGELKTIRRLNNGSTIHAIEFGFGPQSRRDNFLVRLADQNGGQHVYVDISKLGG